MKKDDLENKIPLPEIIDTEDTPEVKLYQEKAVPETKESNFQTILRNAGTDAVNKVSVSRSHLKVKEKTTGDGYIDFDNVILAIEGYYSDKIKFNILASKLFSFANMEALDSNIVGQDFINDTSINLNLYDIASKIGRDISKSYSKSKFKKEVLEALSILKRIEIKITAEMIRGKDAHDRIRKTNLLTSYEYSTKGATKDLITLRFDPLFMEYLSMGYLTPFRKSLLKITDEASYRFHTELMRYFCMPNNHAPRKKGQKTPVQARIISLHTAIDWIGTWQTLEQVKEGDRAYNRSIVEPLEKILDDENGAILKWEWCKAKGERLTEEEKENIAKYDLLKDLFIHFVELKNEEDFIEDVYAGTGRIIEYREKQAKKKAKRASKAKKAQPPHEDD